MFVHNMLILSKLFNLECEIIICHGKVKLPELKLESFLNKEILCFMVKKQQYEFLRVVIMPCE